MGKHTSIRLSSEQCALLEVSGVKLADVLGHGFGDLRRAVLADPGLREAYLGRLVPASGQAEEFGLPAARRDREAGEEGSPLSGARQGGGMALDRGQAAGRGGAEIYPGCIFPFIFPDARTWAVIVRAARGSRPAQRGEHAVMIGQQQAPADGAYAAGPGLQRAPCAAPER